MSALSSAAIQNWIARESQAPSPAALMRAHTAAWPMHLPHLIPGMSHYLWILKTCHAGADMDTAAEMAKGHLDDEAR